ncbi:hypothetical protein Psuf_018600 [Phytohabitans suffuscus]|uniref:Uncharacterized protein n=1 Tax=Phytohabitans suffuscus TaxID=624315 RepID=A0A6F8YEQ3_9ACTN|nr:hypothetical protein Psuf_018600 [Phytohabitans suffuscus]
MVRIARPARVIPSVYLGSVDGVTGNPNLPSYPVSKGGLVTLTHIMANLCGAGGTRVNCIACAAIDLSGTGAPVNQRGDTSDAAERLRLTPVGPARHGQRHGERGAVLRLRPAGSNTS